MTDRETRRQVQGIAKQIESWATPRRSRGEPTASGRLARIAELSRELFALLAQPGPPAEPDTLREALDAIQSPLEIDGPNHMAAVQLARRVMQAAGSRLFDGTNFGDALSLLDAREAQAPATPAECNWRYDSRTDFWDTECGYGFDGSQDADHRQAFCGFCGRGRTLIMSNPTADAQAQPKARTPEPSYICKTTGGYAACPVHHPLVPAPSERTEPR